MRVSKGRISGFTYISGPHTFLGPFVNIVGINCKSQLIYCFQPSQKIINIQVKGAGGYLGYIILCGKYLRSLSSFFKIFEVIPREGKVTR